MELDAISNHCGFVLARSACDLFTPTVRRDPDRGFETPRETEGVDRINVATRPKGRGGGGACSGYPSGWLKVVAVVFTRLSNTPATLGNLGGWIVF